MKTEDLSEVTKHWLQSSEMGPNRYPDTHHLCLGSTVLRVLDLTATTPTNDLLDSGWLIDSSRLFTVTV
jgi:hypothetical protein